MSVTETKKIDPQVESLINHVAEQVRAAFADVPTRAVSGATGLHEAQAWDKDVSEETLLIAMERDHACADQPWSDVDPELLEHSYDVLYQLDEDGFVFFIPAAMMWSLTHRDGEHADALLHDYIGYQFGLEDTDEDTGDAIPGSWHIERRPNMFTPSQREAIAAFLDFDASLDEAEYGHDIFGGRVRHQKWREACVGLGDALPGIQS